MFGLGLEKVEPQRKQDGRQSFPGTIHSSMDQQHRTTFYALKDACGSYKPAILMDSAGFWPILQRTYSGGRTGPLALPGGIMDSGFLVDTSSDVLGGKGLGPCGGRWLGQG